ncbi:prepilin-type N-terminal cleavage/methylation domain-containing protein [candidate division WWE3 bacterium]|nr:prepilin-type N-terminal cleavage/methylation domain-containing protein [candidate division WWE3 bacterium]
MPRNVINKGFTLIEVLIAVSLLSFMLVISVPAFTQMTKVSKLDDTSMSLIRGFEKAYNLAQAAVQPDMPLKEYRVTLSGSGGCYRGYQIDRIAESGSVTGEPLDSVDLACGYSIQSTTNKISFDIPTGQATDITSRQAVFRVCDLNYGYYDVTVDIYGKVSKGPLVKSSTGCSCPSTCTLPPTYTPTPQPTIPGGSTPTPSPTPTVAPTPAVGVTFTRQITSGSNDVNENGTTLNRTGTTLWLGTNTTANASYTGLRFGAVTIPSHAVITNAYLDVRASGGSTNSISLRISGDASDNSALFSTTSRPSTRSLTSSFVDLTISEPWSDANQYQLGNLKSIIQEIVNRPGWVSGNSVGIIIKGSGSASINRRIYSFESSSTTAPSLVITYNNPVIPTPTPTLIPSPTLAAGGNYSLRFYGNGENDIDRVKIRIDGPSSPADIGSTDTTIEFWMKAVLTDNGMASCSQDNDSWIYGNVILDRDTYGQGDVGDYGISLMNGRIAYGVAKGTSGVTLCGSRMIADNSWHHVAVTRRYTNGLLQLYVDGQMDAEATGPTGDIRYTNGRNSSYPNSDPFLVIGAEKHDAGASYPSYAGFLDDIRLSKTRRYTGSFTRPNTALANDGNTIALYRFNEGNGSAIIDEKGTSPGTLQFGGNPAGPLWSTDQPF